MYRFTLLVPAAISLLVASAIGQMAGTRDFSPIDSSFKQGMGPMPHVGSGWKCVMTLDERRQLVAGNPNDLRAAVARGADLRSYSEFIHNEHIDPKSTSAEPVQESMDMRCTYLLDRRWVAGRLKPATLDLCHRLGLDPPLILAIRTSIAQPCFSAPCGCSGVGVTPGPWPRRFWL